MGAQNHTMGGKLRSSRKLSQSWCTGLFLCAGALGAASFAGCSLAYPDCHYLCEQDSQCPSNFRCDLNAGTNGQGLCSSHPEGDTVQCLASVEATSSDSPSDVTTVVSPLLPQPDAGAPPPPRPRSSADAGVPESSSEGTPVEEELELVDASIVEPCGDYSERPEEICVPLAEGGTDCLALTPAMQEGLVLWLDPSSILETSVGTANWWCDRSGGGNHGQGALGPLSIGHDEELNLAPEMQRSVLIDGNWILLNEGSEPMAFDQDDFLVLVAASTPLDESVENEDLYLFNVTGVPGYTLGLSVNVAGYLLGDLSLQGGAAGLQVVAYSDRFFDLQTRLYGIRRTNLGTVGGELNLRINGRVVAEDSISSNWALTAEQSVTTLGTRNINVATRARAQLRAGIVFRGNLANTEAENIEDFVCRNLQACSDPSPGVADVADAGLN